MNRIYRKISCAFALAAIAAGCSDKPLDEAKSYPLTFSVQLADATKAAGRFTASTLESLSEFNVTGYDVTTKVVDNKTVKKSGSMWIIPDLAISWEGGHNMTFFACANMPSWASLTSASSASATFTVTAVPAAAADQWDPLIGYYSGTGSEGKAPITFSHPLTGVKFQTGSLGDAKYNVTGITSVKMKNVHQGGSATTSDGATFNWTPSGTTNVTGAFTGTASTVPFLLIPQNLATNNVELEITVSRSSGGPKTMYATLNTGSWAAGKNNIYTLDYVNNKFGETLTVTLTGWTDLTTTEGGSYFNADFN